MVMLIICSSCSKEANTGLNDKQAVENIDYEQANKDYLDTFTELNDIRLLKPDKSKSQGVFYYVDPQGYLIPVMRQIPKQESIAKSIIKALINNSENRIELREIGLSPILPEKLEFDLALKEDHLMRISFNDYINSFKDKKEEERAIKAIVYTLTEFETVYKVQVLVNNQIVEELAQGTKVGEPLTRGNINSLDHVVQGEYVKSTLYFYNNISNNYTYYIPVTKNIAKDNTSIDKIVQEQIDFFKETNTPIPEGFELEKVLIGDNRVKINIKNPINTHSQECVRFMKSMSLTISQNSDIELIILSQANQDIASYTMERFANIYK